jgi:hypothetical protein
MRAGGGEMDYIKQLYMEVKKRLVSVKFESLWPDFHKYTFALYNSEKVYFEDKIIATTNRFIGNTSIIFEGEYIAIWNIEEECKDDKQVDIDLLAANIVHEMFHAFQSENGETRYPDDIKFLDYPMDYDNMNLKFNENNLLAKASYTSNLEEKSRYLSQFYSIRHKRELIMKDMILAEYLPETVEGMAEYIGTKALLSISEAKYYKRLEQYRNYLTEVSELFFHTRHISYYVGTLLMLVADELGIDLSHKISLEKKTVSELIGSKISIIDCDGIHRNILEKELPCIYENTSIEEFDRIHENISIEKLVHIHENISMEEFDGIHENISVEECAQIHENISIEKFLYTKINSMRSCIDAFMGRNPRMYVGDYTICGYDPMNMFKLDKYIYGNHFWILLNQENNEYIRLFGEAVLLADEGNHIVKYWN